MKPIEENCILSVPDDLVQDILSRVRVRDLLRFRCVSKQWRTLIDDLNFIRKHYHVQHSICKGDGSMPHFVYNAGITLSDFEYFGLLYIQQGDVFTSDITVDLERDSKDVHVCNQDQFAVISIGCVNGIICLNWLSRNTDLIGYFLSLWNPATRVFKAVAYPIMPDIIHGTCFHIDGFGFDPISNDFKIVGSYRIVTENNKLSSDFYEMYSLRTNCWKRPREPPGSVGVLSTSRTDGYFNGVYYWTAELEHKSGHLVILSFNFSFEVFEVSDPPQAVVSLASQSYPFQKMIALYKECLALYVSQQVQEEPLYTIDIWVVTQFNDSGAPLSWQHLFTVEPVHVKLGLRVATSRIDGDLLLSFMFPTDENSAPCGSDEDSECSLYNPLTREYRKLGLDFCTWFRYVESLFPL